MSGCRLGDADTAGSWVAQTLQQSWGVGPVNSERIVMSDQNALAWVTTDDGARLLAKWTVDVSRFARLDEIARLTAWFHDRGLPVSPPLPSLDGSLQVSVDRVSIAVQRVIPGTLLDVSDRNAVQSAGAVLAHLHRTLADYPATDLLRSAGAQSGPMSLADRLGSWLTTRKSTAPRDALDALHRFLDNAPDVATPVQLTHGDVRSANILCERSQVAALLDFEEVRLDHRINEIARSAVLLGTQFHSWGPVSAPVRRTFVAGYESVEPLTSAERAWLPILELWYTLAFIPNGEDPTGWASSAARQLEHLSDRRSRDASQD